MRVLHKKKRQERISEQYELGMSIKKSEMIETKVDGAK